MVQLRLCSLGFVIALSMVAVACGEAPPATQTDSGITATPFIDAGKADAGRDAGIDAGSGFMWADAGEFDAGWVWGPGDGGYGDAGYQVTMCFTGAPARGGSNVPFDVICDDPSVPNVVRSCDGLSCYNTFNTLGTNATSLYAKLFAALDTNGDMLVNAQDQQTRVNLLGYSWGGISAVQVAAKLGSDTRIDANLRRVYRLIVMDAYQPLATLVVPTSVERFVSFRHSSSPSGDCSAGVPLGPFEGIVPRCYANQSCFDYDYSQSPSGSFSTSDGLSYLGSQIGHCEVPAVAAPAILAEFKGMPYSNMPTQLPVNSP